MDPVRWALFDRPCSTDRAQEYLTALEGPFWKQIRGLGLAYSYGISAAPEVLVLDSADVSIVSASAALGTAHVSSDGRVGSDGSRGSTSGRKHA